MPLTIAHAKVSSTPDDPSADIKASDFGSIYSAGPTHVLSGILPAGNVDLSGVVAIGRRVNGYPLAADVTLTKADLGLGNVVNVAPSGLDVRLYGAVGDGVIDDTLTLRTAIVAAGANGVLVFPPGKTFLVSGGLTPLTGQTWWGYGATIKRATQITTTTVSPIGIGGAQTITVASVAGLFVGGEVAVFNGASYDTHTHPILAITGLQVTLGVAFVVAFPAGGTVVSCFTTIGAIAIAKVALLGLTLDGNRANFGALVKWDILAEITISCDDLVLRDCSVLNAACEGIEVGGENVCVEHCRVLNANGNGIHLYGTVHPVVIGNVVKNTNLAGLAPGHADGCITLSDAVSDALIAHNFFQNGISGIGGVDQDDNSGLLVVGNVVRDCATTAVDMIVPNLPVGRVVFAHNQFYNCGPFSLVNTTASVTTGAYRVIISDNYFETTKVQLSRVTDITFVNNQLSSPADVTNIGVEMTSPQRVLLANNHIRGFWSGIYLQATTPLALSLSIRNNQFTNQSVNGVWVAVTDPGGIVVQNNSFLTDAGYAAATYVAVTAGNGTSVLGNVMHLLSGQYGVSCPNGAAGVQGAIVANNVIRSVGLTASIKAFGGSMNNILKDNYVQQAIADGGAGANTVSGTVTIL